MESVCVYDETTVIHELTQGIKMAEQLRVNLNSPEAREFLIQNILSSYDKALLILKFGGQPRASPLPESSPPTSYISTSSQQSTELEFDENVVFNNRKESTPWEDEVRILPVNELEGNTVDELEVPTPGENLSNQLRTTLSFKSWDLDATLPSSLSPNSTQFEFSDYDFHPLNFPDNFDYEELLQGYSSPLISPTSTSESNYFTNLSSSSLEFPTDPTYVYPDFMSE